jgi:hypothetical protein
MSIPGKSHSFVTHYVRNMRGGSQSILAQAADGHLYVVKFNNNLQGANLPFNESIGTELYHASGLAVPSWKPMMVTNTFLDRNPDCWMQTREGRLRPESGLCFGSRFLGGNGRRLLEILPGNSFKRVRNHQAFWLAWLIDICAGHADNRQAIFRETAQGGLNAFFFDNGHLFGGPKGDLRPHFMSSRYLDSRVYQDVSSQYLLDLQKVVASLDIDQLWKHAQALPEQWKAVSALGNFEECLQRLSTPILLQGVIETMVDADERNNGSERSESRNGRTPSISILFPGIQATELGRRLVPI